MKAINDQGNGINAERIESTRRSALDNLKRLDGGLAATGEVEFVEGSLNRIRAYSPGT